MSSPRPKTRKEVKAEKARLADVMHRFLSPNLKARKFCWEHGYTVYPAAQYGGANVKLFIQKGEKFKPLSEKLYNQYDEQDVIEYHAAVDIEYERMYNLKKNVEKKRGE